MPRSASDHARFIRAVHRRLVIVRALEHLGRCVLIGCAVALLLLPILLWRHQPTMPPLIGIAAVCILAAGALLIHGWPSMLMAAAEADRQLNLADLLASAMELKPTDSPPAPDLLTDSVLHMADARCHEFSPSQVVLNRLGARAWGGIGLSVALVLTLALIPFGSIRSDAANTNASVLAESSLPIPIPSDQTTTIQHSAQHLTQIENNPVSKNASRITAPSASPDAKKDSSAGSESSANHHAGTGTDLATNAGAGETSTPHHPGSRNRPQTDIKGSDNDSTGTHAGGADANTNQGTPGESNGTSGGNSPITHVVPPWQATGWSHARQSAIQALSTGRIPDEYHDLVRDYFSHP